MDKDVITPEEQNDVVIYHSKDGKISVALMTRDGNVWLNQSQIATLFGTSIPNVNMHIAKILKDGELDSNSVIKNYLTTATDGKPYDVLYYSLQMIIAIGFRVRGIRGTQFRQWANDHLAEYLVKGFTMDDERLKNPDGRPDYFDELLQRITSPYSYPRTPHRHSLARWGLFVPSAIAWRPTGSIPR